MQLLLSNMTQVGEIESKRIIWMSPDTTLEEKNQSFLRNGSILEIDENLSYFNMFNEKDDTWDTVGIYKTLGTIIQEAHYYTMQKVFNEYDYETRKEVAKEKGFVPHHGNSYKEKKPFYLRETKSREYLLEIRYDSGRMKRKIPLHEIVDYDFDATRSRNETEAKKEAVLGTLRAINYKGNAEFVEKDSFEYTRGRLYDFGRADRHYRKEVIEIDGHDFFWNGVHVKDSPFVDDKLKIYINLYPPTINQVKKDIDEEFDIVGAKAKKLDLGDICNYGMSISVSGTHDKQLSTEEFDFYFKEMLIDVYAELEKKFRLYYNTHAKLVKNFIADFLGMEKGKLPRPFNKYNLRWCWEETDYYINEESWDYAVREENTGRFDSSYHWGDYSMTRVMNDDGIAGDVSPSFYLDYFGDVEKLFPMIGRKTVVSCGNFVSGVTGQTCDINLMKQINATEDEDLDEFFE